MIRSSLVTFFCVIALLAPAGCARKTSPDAASPGLSHSAVGRRAAVATVHPLATQAAVDALQRGGNAIDAAVAAALTLGVVDGHNSGIGGGCFMLIRRAEGTILAIDGREVAPAAATRDMYVRNGKGVPELSQTGALASGVPGCLAAYDHALSHGGKLALADLLAPAADLADLGFAIDSVYAKRLKDTTKDLARFPESARIFLSPEKKPWPEGHVLKQPDLAGAYRAIARNGIGWFYAGPFAQATEVWMKQNGGVLTARDFAAYRIELRKPLVSTYRDCTVVGFPPPSSGGVHVAQVLNIAENFDLAKLDKQRTARRLHVLAEAMKLAFADRAFWLGDPDFAKVPRGLADKEYARALAARIKLDATIEVPSHGQPPHADSDHFGKHTTHIAVADDQGNWVALTTTLNTAFGSKVVIPGTGVLLNNQMDDFSIQPGVPNAFKLVGAEANAIAPGKRPLSSMSPTLVLRNGKPILSLGAAGGPTIISQVILALTNHLDLGMPLPQAVAAPRVHHQWRPDSLAVERALPASAAEQLRHLGHTIETRPTLGVTQAVGKDAENGPFIATHDPRVPGKAAGVDRQER